MIIARKLFARVDYKGLTRRGKRILKEQRKQLADSIRERRKTLRERVEKELISSEDKDIVTRKVGDIIREDSRVIKDKIQKAVREADDKYRKDRNKKLIIGGTGAVGSAGIGTAIGVGLKNKNNKKQK